MDRGNGSFEYTRLRIKDKKPLNLNDQLHAIKIGLLPEPDIKYFPTPKTNCGYTPAVHGDGGLDLQTAVILYPTPRAGVPGSRPNKKGGRILAEVVEKAKNGQDGQLNPDWVEAMMGYPLYWTDVKKDETKNINYPFAWLDGTWENGIPRLTTKKINRISRLKCLGNSVVPEIPALILLKIKSYMEGV
jgi:DNA (cytosine-5)-methyltransferase 1